MSSKQLFSHGSVALSQATLGATVRVLRSEHVQTDIFIRLRRCQRKISEETSSRSPRGLCLLEYSACEDEPRFDNSSVNWGRRKVTWSKNTQTPSILVGGDSLILCLYWQPAQEGSGGGRRKQTFFIFLSRTPRFLLRARSRALVSLADVFKKNEKKNKTTSVYRLAWQEFEREGKGNYSHFFPKQRACSQAKGIWALKFPFPLPL